MKRQIKRRPTARRKPVIKKRKRLSFGSLALFVGCTAIVVGGLFLVAVQHFAAMDLGMQNSQLRRQVDDLSAEKRRLQLAREVTLSPAEIKRTAIKLGFAEVDAPAPMLAAVKNESASETRPAAPVEDAQVVVQKALLKKDRAQPTAVVKHTASAEPLRKRVASPENAAEPNKRAAVAESRPRRVSDRKPSPTAAVAKLR